VCDGRGWFGTPAIAKLLRYPESYKKGELHRDVLDGSLWTEVFLPKVGACFHRFIWSIVYACGQYVRFKFCIGGVLGDHLAWAAVCDPIKLNKAHHSREYSGVPGTSAFMNQLTHFKHTATRCTAYGLYYLTTISQKDVVCCIRTVSFVGLPQPPSLDPIPAWLCRTYRFYPRTILSKLPDLSQACGVSI
jgi:hypothetical protein